MTVRELYEAINASMNTNSEGDYLVKFGVGEHEYMVTNISRINGEFRLGWEMVPTRWRIVKEIIDGGIEEAPIENFVFYTPDEAALYAAQNVYREIGNMMLDIRKQSGKIVSSLLNGFTYSFANCTWKIVGE